MEAGESSNEEFRYKCDECQKRFRQRYNLRIHQRKHTGETPFRCSESDCGMQFKWRSGLVNHMRHHDPTQKVVKRNRRVERPPSPPKAIQPTIANMLNEASSSSQSPPKAKKNDILADFVLNDSTRDTSNLEFWDEPLTPSAPEPSDVLAPSHTIEGLTGFSLSNTSDRLAASLQHRKEDVAAGAAMSDKWTIEAWKDDA
eukprot:Plantae.Rhodophyta-Purpureofilum_apyrenoidigerum.ctg803.p1 GENE.Plantae.Rhodophyta-Purpureofilum_apyrenoidigerum.ctg803~~Plantae.Rhodophyta-Purpureofilum_apyrenoidigerum.ctg803.p1  ORF type:complete len:200 (+),score=26.10 Plantae.Rhodophyta-Purpureofilum_apyrenoidigerum.ctg803:404-1003(+)